MRTVIYSRTARAEQDINGQREACEGYARAHGYDIVHEYADPGAGGSSSPFERAGLGAALSNPAEWDTLVVWDIARVSRDFNDINQLEDWLTEHGKTLEAVDGGLRFPRLGADCPGAASWATMRRHHGCV